VKNCFRCGHNCGRTVVTKASVTFTLWPQFKTMFMLTTNSFSILILIVNVSFFSLNSFFYTSLTSDTFSVTTAWDNQSIISISEPWYSICNARKWPLWSDSIVCWIIILQSPTICFGHWIFYFKTLLGSCNMCGYIAGRVLLKLFGPILGWYWFIPKTFVLLWIMCGLKMN